MFNWLSSLFRNSNLTAKSRPRPQLEWLECRLAPAVLHWRGGANDGKMSTAANYAENPAAVQAGDTIVFDGVGGGGANQNATFDSAFPATIAAVVTTNGYGGGLYVGRDVEVGSFLASSAGGVEVSGANTLSVGNCTMERGGVFGTGSFLVGGSMSIVGSSKLVSTHLVIDSGAQLEISAPIELKSNFVINDGTVVWTTGDIAVGPDSDTFTNNGLFRVAAGGCEMSGPGLTINNLGRIRVELPNPTDLCKMYPSIDTLAGPGQDRFHVAQGTLVCYGEGQSWAPIQIDANAELRLENAVGFTARSGCSFTGNGTLRIVKQLNVEADTILSIQPTVRLFRGTISGQAQVTISSAFYVSKGELSGGLDFVVDGIADFTDTLDAVAITVNNSTLWLNGNSTWHSGQINLQNSLIKNSGVFDARASGGPGATLYEITGAGAQFDNLAAGTLKKTAGAESTIRVPVTTWGTVQLLGNSLRLAGGITQQSGLVDLGGGILNLMTVGGGQGHYSLVNGVLRGGGSITNGNLTNWSGTVENRAGLTIGGVFSQHAAGTLLCVATANDTLPPVTVSGNAAVAGTLAVDLAGFTFAVNVATVIDATTVTGTFGTTTIPTGYDIRYGPAGAPTKVQIFKPSPGAALWSDNPTSNGGDAVTFTAEFYPAQFGGPAVTGTVTFYGDGVALATVALSQGGMGARATYTTSALAVGNRAITAVYNGDANYSAGASAAMTQTVLLNSPYMFAYCQDPWPQAGVALTLLAYLSGYQTPPTGTVSFYLDGVLIGSAPLVLNGYTPQATVTTGGLTAGTHALTAVYSGDAFYAPFTISGSFQVY